MMTMTLTITPAEIQLQLQWYAWVEFLQLLLLCHCRLTRQHSYLQSYHTPVLVLPYSLKPSVSSKLSSDIHSNFVLYVWYVSHPPTLLLTMKFLSQSNSACVVEKNVKIRHSIYIQIFQNRHPEPKIVLPCQCQSPHLMCVPPVSRLAPQHSWAIQSGAMLSPLMGREWEDARLVGTTLRPPWNHPDHNVTKTCILRPCHWFLPLPWSEKHVY